jgi:hypothetical protein
MAAHGWVFGIWATPWACRGLRQTIHRRRQLEGEAEGFPSAVARFHSEPAGLKTVLYFDGSLVSPLGSRPGSWMDARSAPMRDRLS